MFALHVHLLSVQQSASPRHPSILLSNTSAPFLPWPAATGGALSEGQEPQPQGLHVCGCRALELQPRQLPCGSLQTCVPAWLHYVFTDLQTGRRGTGPRLPACRALPWLDPGPKQPAASTFSPSSSSSSGQEPAASGQRPAASSSSQQPPAAAAAAAVAAAAKQQQQSSSSVQRPVMTASKPACMC